MEGLILLMPTNESIHQILCYRKSKANHLFPIYLPKVRILIEIFFYNFTKTKLDEYNINKKQQINIALICFLLSALVLNMISQNKILYML